MNKKQKLWIASLVAIGVLLLGAMVLFIQPETTSEPVTETTVKVVAKQEAVKQEAAKIGVANAKIDWSQDESGDIYFSPTFDVVNQGKNAFVGHVFVYAQNGYFSPKLQGIWPMASLQGSEPANFKRGYKITINHRINIKAMVKLPDTPKFTEAWVYVYDETGNQVNQTKILGEDL